MEKKAPVLEGRAWIFGDHIDTDVILPEVTVTPEADWPKVIFRPIAPEFSRDVAEGDILFAGRNFGCGSARSTAKALRMAKVGGVVAESFARNFFRDAINNGLPILVCRGAPRIAEKGNRVRVDLLRGEVGNLDSGETLTGEPLPSFLVEIIEAGGIVPYLRAQGTFGE